MTEKDLFYELALLINEELYNEKTINEQTKSTIEKKVIKKINKKNGTISS